MDTSERNTQIAIMLGWEYISELHSFVIIQFYSIKYGMPRFRVNL